ncbi:MAG: MGMT family protein, partial [Chloroflexota bacterium]
FRGVPVAFPDALDLEAATEFQRRVWRAAREIPYGETRSYAWIAGKLGQPGATRAVGQALGRNPLLIVIPCHRVLAGDGSLGGFRGGLPWKKFLLGLEKVAEPAP